MLGSYRPHGTVRATKWLLLFCRKFIVYIYPSLTANNGQKQRISLQQALEQLEETDNGNGSEEDGIEDELSWCESEPNLNNLSDSSSEIDASDTESGGEDESADQVLGKDRYLWKTTPKNAGTPRRNIVTGTAGPKGKGREADDAMISEIVTWINKKIEDVRKVYKSRTGFTYDTNETEVRALIGI